MVSVRRFAISMAMVSVGLLTAAAPGDEVPFAEVTYEYDSLQAVGTQEAGFGGSFSLPKFDDQGGKLTLVGVKLVVQGHFAGGVNILENDSPFFRGSNSSVSMEAGLSVFGTTVLTNPMTTSVKHSASEVGEMWQTDFGETSGGWPTGVGDYNVYFSGSDTLMVTFGPTGETVEQLTELGSGDSGLDDFVGSSVEDLLEWEYSSYAHVSHFSTVTPVRSWAYPPDFDFVASVTYVYTPEPATLAILGMGAVGVLMRWRKRSA